MARWQIVVKTSKATKQTKDQKDNKKQTNKTKQKQQQQIYKWSVWRKKSWAIANIFLLVSKYSWSFP